MPPTSFGGKRLRPNIKAERLFFAWLSVAIFVMAVVGFLRTYLLVPALGLPSGDLPATPLVHTHAAVFFMWCILLVVQSWLVVTTRISVHRKLGQLGVLLYLGLVITGPQVAINSTIRYGSTAEDLAFLAVSLGNVIAYTLIFGAAFYWRRSPDIHKRLMLVGMVVLLTAPFGRLVPMPYLLEHVVGPSVVVIALVVWDYSFYKKLHVVTKYVGPGVLLWELLPNLYMNSDWWLAYASWLVITAG